MNKLIFKRIDFWLQITVFLSFFTFTIINYLLFSINNFSSQAYFFYWWNFEVFLPYLVSYLLIIITQIFSIFLNFLEFKVKSKSRTKWQIIFFVLLILSIFSFLLYYFALQIGLTSFLFYQISNFLFFLVCAIFLFSPVLAIWYLIITWTELAEMEKSELDFGKKLILEK